MSNSAQYSAIGLFFWAAIICHYIAGRKKSLGWKRAAYVMYWLLGLSSLFQIIVIESGYELIKAHEFYTYVLIIAVVICAYKRTVSDIWSIGFWLCLIYAIPNFVKYVLGYSLF